MKIIFKISQNVSEISISWSDTQEVEVRIGLNSIKYLGHIIDKNEFHCQSTNIHQCHWTNFICWTNKLLQRILPNLSIFLSPLQVTQERYPLLLVGRWRKAILTSKAMLQSSWLLVHFDPSKDRIRLWHRTLSRNTHG